MTQLIFDCDPGHDDVIALMIALAHPKSFEVLGAVTVAGNQTIEKVTDNLLKVLSHLGVKLPVAAGSNRPLRRDPEPQPEGHGESGLDGPVLAAATQTALPVGGVEFLRDLLLSGSEKKTLVALGPLTNIALLLMQYPETKDRIERIVMMGGSLNSGNILPKAEFNIYHDPEAAKQVFASGVSVVMSGLEVCDAGSIRHAEYRPLENGGKASKLAFDLLEFFSGYSHRRGSDLSPIFDMTPVIHLLHPELFKSARYHLDVETEGKLCRGMTVADFRPFRDKRLDTTEVLLDVDRAAFIAVFLESMAILDAMLDA